MPDLPAIKNKKVLAIFNKLLGLELAAAVQFRLHARLVRRKGDRAVAERLEEMAAEEDRHAATLIDLIDASGYRPVTRPGPVYWPKSPLKVLALNRKNELISIKAYERLVDIFRDDKEVSRLMKNTIKAEKKHIKMLDKLVDRPVKD